MHAGIGFTSAVNDLVLPVIVYLAAGVSQQKFGAIMDGLAAEEIGQTLGSLVGGWLWWCNPADLRMACVFICGVVGYADPAPWLIVGDSYPIHLKSCRYDLKKSARCSLRQNHRSKHLPDSRLFTVNIALCGMAHRRRIQTVAICIL